MVAPQTARAAWAAILKKQALGTTDAHVQWNRDQGGAGPTIYGRVFSGELVSTARNPSPSRRVVVGEWRTSYRPARGRGAWVADGSDLRLRRARHRRRLPRTRGSTPRQGSASGGIDNRAAGLATAGAGPRLWEPLSSGVREGCGRLCSAAPRERAPPCVHPGVQGPQGVPGRGGGGKASLHTAARRRGFALDPAGAAGLGPQWAGGWPAARPPVRRARAWPAQPARHNGTSAAGAAAITDATAPAPPAASRPWCARRPAGYTIRRGPIPRASRVGSRRRQQPAPPVSPAWRTIREWAPGLHRTPGFRGSLSVPAAVNTPTFGSSMGRQSGPSTPPRRLGTPPDAEQRPLDPAQEAASGASAPGRRGHSRTAAGLVCPGSHNGAKTPPALSDIFTLSHRRRSRRGGEPSSDCAAASFASQKRASSHHQNRASLQASERQELSRPAR